MRISFILFLNLSCFFFTSIATAQFRFTPSPENSAAGQSLIAAINRRYEADVKSLSGEHRKYTAEIYKERWEAIKEYCRQKEVMHSTEAQSYLDALVATIVKGNPQLRSEEMRILFSRSAVANAASMGEGTILFNIGLFHRMENEAQVAFILCHEIAHYLLNHGNDAIAQYIAATHSADFQRSLKDIQKTEYGKGKQLEALVQNFTFKTRRHSRQHESAADSMALELMKNTGFDVKEALTSLALLDSTDKDKFNAPLALERHFNFGSYPFKKRWLESDDLVFTVTKDSKSATLADSLKTHPDCQKRIATLSPKASAFAKPGDRKFIVDNAGFESLKKQFDYEIIEYAYNSTDVSLALYYSLRMLAFYPDDAYLNIMVGKCLNDMHRSQKAHELSKIVDLPNPKFGEEYNTLLRFIQNLSLSDIASLSYNFLQQKEPKLAADPDFQKAYTASKNLNASF